MSASDMPYRPCVGLCIFNQEGKIFVGERIDNPGAWQMPQGGIDDGENIEAAAFREMKEEIGTDKAEILEIMEQKLRYETPLHLRKKLQATWGKPYIGQEQTWIALRFIGSDADIDIAADNTPEFKAWQWVGMQESLDLIVPFKKQTYKQVITVFEKHSSL